MIKNYRIISTSNQKIAETIQSLGRIRLQVFREFPYLYDGSISDEIHYLSHYGACSGSLVLRAFHGEDLIGVSTCLPMVQAQAAFRQPFEQQGWDCSTLGYLGESVILAEHRGHGLGRKFFQLREAHLKSLGCQIATFCAVDRPADHALRPQGYRPLDSFWIGLGYRKQERLKASFSWRQVDEQAECLNTLTYWTKSLP